MQLVSADTDSAFFLLYWKPIPCNGPFVVHLSWKEQLTVKYLSGTSSQTEPFLLQTSEGYQHPKFSAEAFEVVGQPKSEAW